MDILVKPIVTEKMTQQGERYNRYGFLVRRHATKQQIRLAVQSLYGVTVETVNTMICAGKKKSRFTKAGVISGKMTTYKKAIVTLSKGENIDFYSNI